MKKLTNEQISYIRKLQESGISDKEISAILGLNYSTVYYHRPDVRERHMQYKKERIKAIRKADFEAYLEYLRSLDSGIEQ